MATLALRNDKDAAIAVVAEWYVEYDRVLRRANFKKLEAAPPDLQIHNYGAWRYAYDPNTNTIYMRVPE